jgi:hypothetical protein
MSHVVYARVDTTVVWSGGISPITVGEVWDSEAKLVTERPELFSAEPTRVRGRVARPPAATTPDTCSEPQEQARVVDKTRRKGAD